MSDTSGATNRLAQETSPYLLLHATNPVDWYPWGEEALQRARDEDKPIFLSVGYATCYWCHVMERESFADAGTAALMNENFVNIKLDREERPELDEIYMAATQLLTSPGGWPNSVFLTPELKPFFAGTYFPPQARGGMPGFRDVLNGMINAWQHRRNDVGLQAEELEKGIRRFLEERGEPGDVPDASVPARGLASLTERFDARHGGFGGAPKFPSPGNLYLLDALAAEDSDAAHMLDSTLDRMARGGIYDQLGGGFHRYATDAAWLIPHFEKMLYDNGHLLTLYARAHVRTGNAAFARVVHETAAFLDRELSHPDGGFLSAIDAETDGFEGAYYVWTLPQLVAALGDEDASFLAPLLGWDGSPFFESEYYVLHLPEAIAEQAARRRQGESDLLAQMAPLRAKLLAARDERKRPLTDDKILTDWNGMVIAGLAEAGRLLEAPAMVERAARGADFVLRHLRPEGGDGPLRHSWREDTAKHDAFLGDYAFFVGGLLRLYEATGEARWLDEAIRLTDEQITRLADHANGGFFVAAASPDVLFRSKEMFDGALPATNAAAVLNLVDLARLDGAPRWRATAERALRTFAVFVTRQPEATRMLNLALHHFHQLGDVGTGDAGDEAETDPAPVSLAWHTPPGTSDDGWQAFAVTVTIAPGWHVYGPERAEGVGSPTVLVGEAVALRDVVYPEPTMSELAPGQPEVPIYAGTLVIEGKLKCQPYAPSPAVELRYQPCDDVRCLEATSVRLAVET